MKGVIVGICPAAQAIDMTHGVQAFDVLEGALAIWQAWRYFPAETIHVIVVDPGVGSVREPVLSRMGEAWFIAPDNGVLTLVERDVRRSGGTVLHRSIENSKYMLPAQSNTFHGRDIFAPAAAHLALQIERGYGCCRDLRSSDQKPDPTAHARAYSKTPMVPSKASS